MAEETESTESGGENATAISLGLAGASRVEADAFLRDQRHHLHEQIKHLDLGIWEKRIGIALRLATLFVGLAVAAALGAMVWDAANSKGLIIEPFAVPGDMAGRGLNGQVIASQMIGKLTAMTARESSRAAQSYANNWGDNIKVEIPETGVSIGELRNFLRDWLGHDIHISGEVFHTATGITVTARAGGSDAGGSFSGAENDLDALLQKAAEHLYEVTQPYRYANYLDRDYTPAGLQDRIARATAIYRRLIAGDDPVERAWAWNGLGTIEFNFYSNQRQSSIYYLRSIATVPDFTIGYFALASRNGALSQEMERWENYREADRLLSRVTVPELNPHYTTYARYFARAGVAMLVGDYGAAVAAYKAGAELPDDFSVLQRGNFIANAITAMARLHDLSAVRAYLRAINDFQLQSNNSRGTRINLDLEAGDWQAVNTEEAAQQALIAQARDQNQRRSYQGAYGSFRASFALAKARQGDFGAAEILIASTESDNDPALRTRGLIAELQGQHARADWWFSRAAARAPHVPFADLLWGQALMARGQPDAAIAKFTQAHKLGPHFADPLEAWGEALMAKNQSHLALAKFAEAEKSAPNWGRLHLKWGEALVYAGKKVEAAKQFARAAQLDLTPDEKAELARHP